MTLGDKLWTPTPSRAAGSAMRAFRNHASRATGQTFVDYWALYEWSAGDVAAFWQVFQDFTGVRWHTPPTCAFIPPAPGKMLGGRWFPDGTLNFAENLMAALPEAGPVITGIIEGRATPTVLDATALRRQVARCAAAMKRDGIAKGDRVVAVIGNTAEAVIAMLATTSLGAIWSSCSPDFGVTGITDRFGQLEPKLLIGASSYQYNGKTFDCRSTLAAVLERLPTVRKTVTVAHAVGAGLNDAVTWDDYLGTASPELTFAPVPFNHPLFIMFSSGTTGVPKCIVHGHGGTLLQHKKELALHSDIRPGDTLCYYTTCGWMMWNWMVSALATGARLVLFEGSVSYPDLGILWATAAQHGVTHLGISPKLISSCIKANVIPKSIAPSPKLRTVLSTGSPLLPEHFEWVYREVSADVHLASISGGTDIISCFMLGNPELPVHSGEIQAPGLGMAIAAWNDDCEANTVTKGELVCTMPFVSMPVGFWGDLDDRLYHKAYFEHYPDREVWRHGDFIAMTSQRGIVVHGRSDATLNPGGIRIGTSEIYRVVERLDGVADSLAVELNAGIDGAIALFVKLSPGQTWTEALGTHIKSAIRQELSPRHVPSIVRAVADIPYTRSGKKVELAVGTALKGEDVKNTSALANPESLAEYVRIGYELRATAKEGAK